MFDNKLNHKSSAERVQVYRELRKDPCKGSAKNRQVMLRLLEDSNNDPNAFKVKIGGMETDHLPGFRQMIADLELYERYARADQAKLKGWRAVISKAREILLEDIVRAVLRGLWLLARVLLILAMGTIL